MTSWTRAEIGTLGEDLAVEHLTSLGLQVLDRNWRCRCGELDIIAADDATRTAVRIDVIGVRIGRQRSPEITHVQAVG